MSDGGSFDWGLTPRKPEPEKQPEPEKPADDPFAFLNAEPEKPEPEKEEWVGEPTQAMPLNAPPALIEPRIPPEPPRAPLPTAPAYPPPQQFRPPSQYPQQTPPPAEPATPPAWPFAAQQLPPTQAQHLPPAQVPTRAPSQSPDAAAGPTSPVTGDASASTVRAMGTALPADRHDIDDIFGEHAFQEYDDGSLIGQIPLPSRTERGPRAPLDISRSQKVLMLVAGGLVAALALVAIYVAGTHIDLNGDPEPAAVATPEPTPTETAAIEGPVEPGVYQWNALLGTECLDPFENAWAQEYTVVDCESPHSGQLTAVGAFEQTEFPGEEALATDANLACASTKVINYKKASVYDDIAISASYATTQQEWTDGFTVYYCFVARTSGEPIEGTIARAFGTAAG